MPESSSLRFEVSINGVKRGVAGLPGYGVISVDVCHTEQEPGWVPPTPEEEHPTHIMFGSLDSDANEFRNWIRQEPLNPGDVVTITVLPPGPFDPPIESRPCLFERPEE